MSSDQIVSLIISIAPSFISILTMIGVIARTLKAFADLKKQVTDMKVIEDLKKKLDVVIEENISLKKTLNETMTKIDHVKRD